VLVVLGLETQVKNVAETWVATFGTNGLSMPVKAKRPGLGTHLVHSVTEAKAVPEPVDEAETSQLAAPNPENHHHAYHHLPLFARLTAS